MFILLTNPNPQLREPPSTYLLRFPLRLISPHFPLHIPPPRPSPPLPPSAGPLPPDPHSAHYTPRSPSPFPSNPPTSTLIASVSPSAAGIVTSHLVSSSPSSPSPSAAAGRVPKSGSRQANPARTTHDPPVFSLICSRRTLYCTSTDPSYRPCYITLFSVVGPPNARPMQIRKHVPESNGLGRTGRDARNEGRPWKYYQRM